MDNINLNPQKFIVTTPGLSATRWLSFALAKHREVFVTHGKHPLDSVVKGSFNREKKIGDIESLTLGNRMSEFYQNSSLTEVFETYQAIMPVAKAIGNVHTYTLDELIKRIGDDQYLANINIINVVRHPINYIASHYALVQSSEQYPLLYKHYEQEFQKALRAYPELFLMDCYNYRNFLAFAVSCWSVCNQEKDFAYTQFDQLQMEQLTTEIEKLEKFCQFLTGLDYSDYNLDAFIQQGAINQHRTKTSSRDPHKVYAGWENWQRDMVYMMLPANLIDYFAKIGYDISMLHDNEQVPSGPKEDEPLHEAVLCLGDYLPPSVSLPDEMLSDPKLVEEDYRGFDIVIYNNKFHALARSLGIVDLTGLNETTLEQEAGYFYADSYEELCSQVDQFAIPQLITENYYGYNIVRYQAKFFAMARTLGPIDLSKLDEETWQQYQDKQACFIGHSLEEVSRLTAEVTCQKLQNQLKQKDEQLRILEQKVYTLTSAQASGMGQKLRQLLKK